VFQTTDKGQWQLQNMQLCGVVPAKTKDSPKRLTVVKHAPS